MIRILSGSPAASLVASIIADRLATKPSRSVKKRRGLTTELPDRFRRPLIKRQAICASVANG
jgi:hypothetical protein